MGRTEADRVSAGPKMMLRRTCPDTYFAFTHCCVVEAKEILQERDIVSKTTHAESPRQTELTDLDLPPGIINLELLTSA